MDRKLKSNTEKTKELRTSHVQKVHSSSDFASLETYDLTNPDYKIHDLLPTLELINQRFSQLFRHAISGMFRTNIDVQFETVDSLQAGDYLANETTPELKHIYKSSSLKCSGFMAMEPSLLLSLVDLFFGGTGDPGPINANHELTTSEIRIFQRILKTAADKQADAWASILPFKIRLADNYNSPITTLFRSDTEIILLSQFTLQMGSRISQFHVVMPYQALEPVREKLQAFKFTEQDPLWQKNMFLGLMKAPLELSSRLCSLKLSLREVLRLKPGQIVQVDIPSYVTVKVAGIPTYKAHVCTVQNTLAMKIIKKLHEENYKESDVNEPEEKEVHE